MSELPEGWAEARLDQIGNLRMGKTILSKELVSEGLPVYSAGTENKPWGYVAGSDTAFPRGTIIVSARGTIGAVKVPDHDLFVSTQTTIAVSPEQGVDPEFLARQLSLFEFASVTATTAIPMLTISKFGPTAVKVPPLPEQRRIVAKLDRLSARTKAARAHLARVQSLATRAKQATLAAAFRGQLTATWRQANPPEVFGDEYFDELLAIRRKEWIKREALKKAKSELEVSKRYKPPETASDESLAELPNGWIWLPTNALTTKVSDGVHKKPKYVPDGVPFVTVKNLTAGPGISFEKLNHVTIEDHREFIKRTDPEVDDILISKDGTLGVIRRVKTEREFSVFVSVALVKPADRRLSPYLEYAFQSPQVQEQMVGVGSGLQHIHLTDLRKDMIPVAPPCEQSEIVRRIEAAFARIDRMVEDATRAAHLLDRLDQRLLIKAFRGELVPQDSNDEPAAELLARIKAARADAPISKRGGRRRA